jgi:hypothetical protein
VQLDIHLHRPRTGLAQLLRMPRAPGPPACRGVAVSHAYSLGEVPLAARAAGGRSTGGRRGNHEQCARRSSIPRCARAHDAGVRVFAGNDNIRDCWWPYGNGDLLQRAMLLGYRSGFYTDDDLMLALDMVTTRAGDRLPQHGIAEG